MLAALTHGSWWSLIGLSFATVGIYGMKPSFWPMPSLFLTGTAAAAGIAWINAVGNLAGTITPFVVGWIKDVYGQLFRRASMHWPVSRLMSSLVTLVALPSESRAAPSWAPPSEPRRNRRPV